MFWAAAGLIHDAALVRIHFLPLATKNPVRVPLLGVPRLPRIVPDDYLIQAVSVVKARITAPGNSVPDYIFVSVS